MKVSVVYAEPHHATQIEVDVPDGTTVQAAIDLSGLSREYPSLTTRHVGIFGKQVPLDTRVEEGDRIEIYRPLPMDPKRARQERAAAKRFFNMFSAWP